MKLRLEIELEPGEDPVRVARRTEDWLDRGATGITNSERLTERLVASGVNISEEDPEWRVVVE